MGLVVHRHTPLEQVPVERLVAVRLGHRHEQGAPDRADLGLHVALLRPEYGLHRIESNP